MRFSSVQIIVKPSRKRSGVASGVPDPGRAHQPSPPPLSGSAFCNPNGIGRCAIAATLVFLLGTFAHAQDSRFIFDPNGNLLVQSPEAIAPPQIIGQPQNRIVVAGESASFSVVALDTRLLNYQWRFTGIPLGGSATNDAFLLQNVSTNNEGEYRVVLTNPSGSVTSAPAFLMIDSDADGMSDFWEMAHFGNLNQYASGDADGDGSSNLQEFQDGSDPTGSNSVYFRLVVLRDGGSVLKTLDKSTYTNGETVTLTGSGLPGQEPFHAWMGDILTRSNPVTLVMTNNKTVIARFTPIVFTWTNPASGDWDVATNWTPNLAPGSNDTVIIPNGTVTLNSPANCADVTLDAGALTGSGTLIVWGNFVWNSGTMSGSGRTIVETNSTLQINSEFASLNTRTLENAGTTKFTGPGSLTVTGGAAVTNRPGALLHVQNAASIGGVFNNGRLDNAGTFRKSGSGTATFGTGVLFNNTGTVEIETGTLSLAGGGTNSSTFTTAPTAIMEWTGGTFTLIPGSHLNGTGLYRIDGSATVVGDGDITVQNLDLVSPSGTWSGTGILTIASAMNWSGGTMSGGGLTIITPGVTLQLPGPNGVGLNTRTLENAGTVIWTGSGSIGMNSGVISNRVGALFHVQNASSLETGFGVNRFDNAGTFRKSAIAGTTTLNSIFNNSGTVEIQTGMLLCNGLFTNNGVVNLSAGTTNRCAGGGSGSGAFTAPATALVEWTGGTFTLNTGAQLNGPGLYKIDGSATVVGNADITLQNLDLVSISGAWNGTGILTIANAMNWTAGSMAGSGRTLVSPGATLQLGSASSVSFSRTLENGGSAFWTGSGGIIMGSATFTNRPGALFQAQSSAPILFVGGPCRFDNAGIFRKSSSTGATTVPAGVSFTNFGTVDIRSGILVANGGYASTSNALLNCALGGTTAGTNYAQLQVAGTVTLNGGLSVDLLPGFSPATNDTFTVLSAGTRNNTFSSFSYPSNQVTMLLSNSPNSVILRVTDVLPVPQPVLLTPQLVGTNALLTWTATSNMAYRLEFNPGVGATSWIAILGDITTLSNTASKLDPLTPSNRFYRVRVLP
jgi:hypothetical protein